MFRNRRNRHGEGQKLVQRLALRQNEAALPQNQQQREEEPVKQKQSLLAEHLSHSENLHYFLKYLL